MAQLRRKTVSSSNRKIENPIAKAMSRAKHSSFYHELSLRGENPLRLLGTPKDIWPGSVTAGTQMVSGRIVAGGHILENPLNDQNIWERGDIWRATNLNESWLEYLHSFSWLKDLNQAVDQSGAKKRSQELVDEWIDRNTQWNEIPLPSVNPENKIISVGENLFTYQSPGGVFISTDGGTIWERRMIGLPQTGGYKDLIFFNRSLYVITNYEGVYKSNEEGDNWEKVNGIPINSYSYFAHHNNKLFIISDNESGVIEGSNSH